MARKLKCECGTCHVCKCRERAREKARMKKQAVINKKERLNFADTGVLPGPSRGEKLKMRLDEDNNGHEEPEPEDPMAARELALRKRGPKGNGAQYIMFINRVGIPLTADVFRDGNNICIRTRLGDVNAPEEPVSYHAIKRLSWRKL